MENDQSRQNRNAGSEDEPRSGEPGGGAGVGRREEVGGSGVHPASAAGAPDDAVVRTPGEWGEGAGGEEGGRSELHLTDEQIRAAERGETSEDTEPKDERP